MSETPLAENIGSEVETVRSVSQSLNDSSIAEGALSDKDPVEEASEPSVLPQEHSLASAGQVESDLPSISFQESLLGLASLKGLGRKGLNAFINSFDGDLGRVWGSTAVELQLILEGAKVPSAEKLAIEIVENCQSLIFSGQNAYETLLGRDIVIIPSSELPDSLRQIPDPPKWLFVQGNAGVLYDSPSVAVVGTRNPSNVGITAAGVIAKHLAAYPVVLVSGLAEGIDEEAHRASLQEGVKNIAFLGHGINVVFPATTKTIRQLIIDRGGAVASEYLPNEHYQKHYFVERNRLQAALSQIVIPVEANPKGGTAHTIRFARNYKRQVVGIRWEGANGILKDLEAGGFPIIDIFTHSGRKQLDKIFRDLAESFEHSTYAFSVIEKRLRTEMRQRAVRETDVERLLSSIQEMSKGV